MAPRFKAKYLPLVNKKSGWCDDKEKLGQKLLEKYGWKEGKGLGKDEQGITDPVKTKNNSDKRGLGFTKKACTVFNEIEYDKILANLNDLHTKSSKEKEIKVKLKKTKPHRYNKIIKSKVLIKYSEKDLSCLFPKFNDDTEKDDTETTVKEENGVKNETKNENSIVYNSGLSISEYFSAKMKQNNLQFVNNYR